MNIEGLPPIVSILAEIDFNATGVFGVPLGTILLIYILMNMNNNSPSPPSTKFTRDKMGDVLTEELANEFLAGNLLFLSNFKDINFAAAQLLGHCDKKNLILNDLTVLDDASAEALSEYPGDLSLLGLKDISDTAAQHLAKRPNLTITLGNLPASAAKILADAGHG